MKGSPGDWGTILMYLLMGICMGLLTGFVTEKNIGIAVGVTCSVVLVGVAQVYLWITHIEIEEIKP